MDKQRNVRRDVTNSCADSMLNRITECFKDSLKGIPQIKSAVIDSINEDGSINIFFPPNETKLFTRISNQSPFTLSPGDGVEIMLKNGSFDNCWIIAKHGVTRADMNTQQNKVSNDTLKNINSNIDSIQIVGVTKTSQLVNDSKFISQDEPIINSPDLRGMPTTPTASKGDNSSQIANTAFVFEAIQDVLEESKVLTFEGTIGTDGTVQELPDEHAQGDVYIISNSGLYAGYNCNIGDLIICIKDGLSKDDKDWYVIRTDLSNYIIGPLSSSDNHVAIFDGDSGKIIKDSGYTIGKSVPPDAVFTDTIIEVVDSLDSTESEKALSANQGKILNDKVIKKADSSTTLSGYGIKDAKIENGVITLGENTITPITSLEDANLTGIPTAPTPDNTVNNNQIATTSFVHTFVAKAQESGVIGPDLAVNEHVAVFDGTTGKVIKDSGFTIGKSVPSNAVFTDTVYTHPKYEKHNIGFYKIETNELGHVVSVEQVTKEDIVNLGIPSEDTDTHYTCKNVVNNSNIATEESTVSLSNGEVYLNTVENNTVTSSHKIIGEGNIKVTTDENGNIIISYVESSSGAGGESTTT